MIALVVIAEILRGSRDLRRVIRCVLAAASSVVDMHGRALEEAIIVPLSAGTSLPHHAAKVAELGSAKAAIGIISQSLHSLVGVADKGSVRHVITSSSQLYDSAAPRAPLPSVLSRRRQQLLRLAVFTADAVVVLSLALDASDALTFRARRLVLVVVPRLDEGRASRHVAVCSVLRLQLDPLDGKRGLELWAQLVAHELPGKRLPAAAWWEEAFVGHAGTVEVLQARSTVVMAARGFDIVREEMMMAAACAFDSGAEMSARPSWMMSSAVSASRPSSASLRAFQSSMMAVAAQVGRRGRRDVAGRGEQSALIASHALLYMEDRAYSSTQLLRRKEACLRSLQVTVACTFICGNSEGPVAFGCDGRVPVVLLQATVVDDAGGVQSVTKLRRANGFVHQ